MSNERDGTEYLRGALYGLAAVSIWSGWIVVARLGLRTSLTPWDIAALRFGVAGLLLLPYVISKGLAVDRLGWAGLAAIVLGGAAPVFLANSGLLFAPAAHAGALFPGAMPLMVALLAALLLREEFTLSKKIGFALILPGVLAIAWGSGGELGSLQNVGHGLFLSAGLAWAFYTIAMRKARHAGNDNCSSCLERHGIAGLRAGLADRNFVSTTLWSCSRHPRCVERRSLRRAVPRHDRAIGNSNSWRVADAD